MLTDPSALRNWKRGSFACPDYAALQGLQRERTHEIALWGQVEQLVNPWTAPTDRAVGTEDAFPVVEVNRDVWNSYWIDYSERCGDALEDHSLNSVLDDNDWHLHSSSVFIAVNGLSDIFQQQKKEGERVQTIRRALLTAAVFYARKCGAIENVVYAASPACADHLGIVHFSSEAAASVFLLWLGGMCIQQLWSVFGRDLQLMFPVVRSCALCCPDMECVCGSSTHVLTLSASFSVPYDTSCLANKNMRNATSLLLGPNVFLATPFITNLFCGMMDALRVEYNTSTKWFLIEFVDARSARLALHTMQHSLWKIFGLSLLLQ